MLCSSPKKRGIKMIFETIQQFKKNLMALDACMQKAAAYADHKKFDVNVLVQARLAPDMFQFSKQVQSACDAAKFCAAYLSETKPPVHEDNETTWAQLRERIQKSISFLNTMKPDSFKNAANVKVAPKWADGKWLPGTEYFYQLAIPNFYFHMTTAYALMRHNGVDIGKADYIGELNFRS